MIVLLLEINRFKKSFVLDVPRLNIRRTVVHLIDMDLAMNPGNMVH